MAKLKICNWNIEWMNKWFGSDAGPVALKPSGSISGVSDIDDLVTRVAKVIKDMDPDILAVQEGPSRYAEMTYFVTNYLGGKYEIIGPSGNDAQKLYALVKKSGPLSGAHKIEEEFGFEFDEQWDVDIDGDMKLTSDDEYDFTRTPLVLKADLPDGRTVRFINLHSKSKFVYRGRSLWNNPATRQTFVEEALLARRRIAAEAARIRTYLNLVFQHEPDAPVVVAGDFNDGPGMDYFERLYLSNNVAGLIAGTPFNPQTMLRHAFVDQVSKKDNYTAVFDDFVDGIKDRKVLLDHIFLSASLYWKGSAVAVKGRIEHKIWNNHSKPGAPGHREKHPSDHRPQTAEVTI